MCIFEPHHGYQEYRVCSYEEIHALIEEYNRFYNLPRPSAVNEPDVQAFYRGQADSMWDIAPSISFTSKTEPSIIRDFTVPISMPLFETIAYIQHHHGKNSGTRFIDFTRDPDIATFFACNQHPEKDGALFACVYRPHKPEWYTSIVLAELASREFQEEITVGQFSESLYLHYPEFRERFESIDELSMSLVSFLDHGFMVLPDEQAFRNNKNMERQKGCFYICGVDFGKELTSEDRWLSRAGRNRFIPRSAIFPHDMKKGNFILKIIIPAELKPEILHRLASRGITQKKLFPEKCEE